MVWGRLLDRQAALKLLAANASGKVKGGLDNYEPPSAMLADQLDQAGEKPVEGSREAQIAMFVAQAGGG